MNDDAALLLFSLGPIQEFIATARRCGDLWFGSWLLGDLSRVAVKQAAGTTNAAVVLPAISWEESRDALRHGSVANKVLVRVSSGVGAARMLAGAMQDAVNARRDAICRVAFDRVAVGDPSAQKWFLRSEAEAQVAELIEMFWVVVPEKGSYAEARREAERLLAGRKNSRQWSKPGDWSKAGARKSSLDGARESVLQEGLFRSVREQSRLQAGKQDNEQARKKAAWLHQHFRVRTTERLCGVGLLKRFGRPLDAPDGSQVERFFSTSHVAALPWMIGAQQTPEHTEHRALFEAYLATVEASFGRGIRNYKQLAPMATGDFGQWDGQLLFASRLEEVAEELAAPAGAVESVRQALARYVRAVENTPREPLPYLALLLADGDHMGALINRQDSVEGHAQVSRALAEFAAEVEHIVNGSFHNGGHHGSLIYAGGDDVLALLPLHTVLPCADVLRRAFAARMAPFAVDEEPAPTLSVGVAIHHHLEPLSQARRTAKAAEKRAKRTRNALAVTFDPRGGTPLEVGGLWSSAQDEGFLGRLRRLIDLRQEGEVPSRAGHELARLELRLKGASSEVRRVEARRILHRKENRGGTLLEPVREQLVKWAADEPAKLGRELVLADILAQALTQARQTTRDWDLGELGGKRHPAEQERTRQAGAGQESAGQVRPEGGQGGKEGGIA